MFKALTAGLEVPRFQNRGSLKRNSYTLAGSKMSFAGQATARRSRLIRAGSAYRSGFAGEGDAGDLLEVVEEAD